MPLTIHPKAAHQQPAITPPDHRTRAGEKLNEATASTT
jgi:hypothetical protein